MIKVADNKLCFYKVSAPSHTPLPFIKIQCGKYEVSSLIDSGASRSLISGNLFNMLSSSRCVKRVEQISMPCYTATDEPMVISHKVLIHFKLQGLSWDFSFLVAPSLRCDAILGVDFLAFTGLVLDLRRGQIHFDFLKRKKILPITCFDPITPLRSDPEILDDYWESIGDFANFVNSIVEMYNQFGDDEISSIDLSHLPVDKKEVALKVLNKYTKVLTKKLGCTNVLEYDIILNDLTPVRNAPYSLSPPKMEFIRGLIKKLLDLGVIRPSKSSYASPAFLVPKGEDDFRMVIDYRDLNRKVDIEAVPIPDINTAFSWFGKAKWFCVLDMNSAYHQVPLSERCKRFTAFCLPFGLYEWERLPFGLATGAQVLTRLGRALFEDLLYRCMGIFIDDLVIWADTFEELMQILDTVLSRLAEAGITLCPSKLRIAVQEFVYLGHLKSLRGLEIDPGRTAAIRNYDPPVDAKGVSRFIGMVNFYSKFIPKFSERSAALNKLRKKGVKFEWGKEQMDAFKDLKKCIIQPPILQTPDFEREFIVQSDGSSLAVGAVLLQEFDGERLPISYVSRETTDEERARLPIAFASRTLTEQERKYSAYEIECLAVVFALEKFRVYLEHKEFLLECDNEALTWLLAHTRQLGRIARWVIRISAFKFRVKHIRGTTNVTADALSRMFNPSNEDHAEEHCEATSVFMNVVKLETPIIPFAYTELLQYQLEDKFLSEKISAIKKGNDQSPYFLNKGVLCCNDARTKFPKIVVPPTLVPMIFKYYHASVFGAHLGVAKTIQRIRSSFIYPKMNADITRRVKKCEVCALSKPAQNMLLGKLASMVAERPMQKLNVDFVGPLVRSKQGNLHIFVCTDSFTKFVWFWPVRSATADSAIKCLKLLFQSFGFSECLTSDNGKHFDCAEFNKFCFRLGIQHRFTPRYYPQANPAERVNRNLRSALIAYHANCQNTWDENLHWLQLAFNLAYHEGHKHTPFELMFTYPPAHPLSLHWSINELLPASNRDIKSVWDSARKHLWNAHKVTEKRYNLRRKEHRFAVDDLVLVKAHHQSSKPKKFTAKLAYRWDGPFKVSKFVSPVSVLLVDPKNFRPIGKSHVSQLKAYVKPT